MRLRRRKREEEHEHSGPQMCSRGVHVLTEANTFIDRHGVKRCRSCWAEGYLDGPAQVVVRDPFFRP